DAVGSSADVPAAVALMPDRSRELEHIDIAARHDVFEYRPGIDDLMRNDAHLLEIGVPTSFAELPFGEILGKAERHVSSLSRKHVQQQAKTLGASGNFIKHHARAILGAQHRFGSKADVFLPARPSDRLHLAELLGPRKPFP